MESWKVHVAMSYPLELLSNELIDCLRVELWMRTPDFAYLVSADEDLLVLLYVPADTAQAAIDIALSELDQALVRMELPGVTSYDTHALLDSPEDRPLTQGIKGLIITFC